MPQTKVTNLRLLRRKRGLSIVKLSELTGIDKALLSRYERGLSEPMYDNLTRLAAALEVTPTRIMELIRSPAAEA